MTEYRFVSRSNKRKIRRSGEERAGKRFFSKPTQFHYLLICAKKLRYYAASTTLEPLSLDITVEGLEPDELVSIISRCGGDIRIEAEDYLSYPC